MLTCARALTRRDGCRVRPLGTATRSEGASGETEYCTRGRPRPVRALALIGREDEVSNTAAARTADNALVACGGAGHAGRGSSGGGGADSTADPATVPVTQHSARGNSLKSMHV